ncbi:growth hormone secretagogue receptor type 1-like [Ruditapes philippinarum]|uniref:growth hormone secretagogue receptor type 1-like n=1 Tax=Ruditapes philippinarum TaxID=129788 RepID=UPI00295A7659|nr:growth hormone secretagogue receptor type 1-like [Ruditapes philippinarum]
MDGHMFGNDSIGDMLNESKTENTTSSPAKEDSSSVYYEDINVMLWKIVPPILIIFGTTGNTLTILVNLRMKKITSTSLYLITLAISDTTILLCGPLRNWITYMWGKDIRKLSDGACRTQLYLTYASVHFSSWLLVAVTIERTISVVIPHKVKLSCTRKNAGITILAIFVFTFGVDAVIPVIQGLEGFGNKACAPTTAAYLKFRDDVWQWIDLCMAFAVPFFFLVTGNSIMIVTLCNSRRKRIAMSEFSIPGGNTTSRKDISIYVLMIALCCIFLLTMTPVVVYQIYSPYRLEELRALKKIDPVRAWEEYYLFLLQHTIVNLVTYVNAAMNFVLYVFTGTKFRTELTRLFCCNRTNGRVYMAGKTPKKTSEEIKTKTTSVSTTSSSKECMSKLI